MQYAIVDFRKKSPSPEEKGVCQCCNRPVIAKCGDIRRWHWAHEANSRCDGWYENESEWHRNWKIPFGEIYSEVVIEKDGKRHIADILTKDNIVIELQNSKISQHTIIEREKFYGERMLWILNGENFDLQIQSVILHDSSDLMIWDNETLGIPIWKTNFSSNLFSETMDKLLKSWGFKKHSSGKFYFEHSTLDSRNYVFHNTKLNQLKRLIERHANQGMKSNKDKAFICRYPHLAWQVSERPIFIDINQRELFYLHCKFGTRYGNGEIVSKERFLKRYCK